MNDTVERMASTGLDDHMHMIGHDAPGEQAIPVAVEVKQRRLGQCRDIRPSEPARSPTVIEFAISQQKIVGISRE